MPSRDRAMRELRAELDAMRDERDEALALAAQLATRRLAAQGAIRLWAMNAAAAMADCDELRADVERLRECMRMAGLAAFMRDGEPGDVAEHLRSVIASHDEAATKAEAELAALKARTCGTCQSGAPRSMIQLSRARCDKSHTWRGSEWSCPEWAPREVKP